jgi:hypothetical protein
LDFYITKKTITPKLSDLVDLSSKVPHEEAALEKRLRKDSFTKFNDSHDQNTLKLDQFR